MKKLITDYKIFESIDTDFLKSNRILNYTVVNGEVNVIGNVSLSNRNLDTIPVKFGDVSGFFDCSRNNLKTFEFLPYNCDNYIIYGNPGITPDGLIEDIFNLVLSISGGIEPKHKPLFNKFIKNCLDYDVWYKGTNESAMSEAWHMAKLSDYNLNKDIFMSSKSKILSISDSEILKDHFNIKTEDWILDVVDQIVEKMKSKESEKLHYFKLLCNLISEDFDNKIEAVVKDKYDLEDIYKKADQIRLMSDSRLETLLKIFQKKLTRDEETIERDNTLDLFVFIGSEKFTKKENGDYKKSLDIESLVKVNIYNPDELQQVNMMKFRSMANKGSDAYMIWIPKDTFEVEKDMYSPDEIPEFILNGIDKKKTRI